MKRKILILATLLFLPAVVMNSQEKGGNGGDHKGGDHPGGGGKDPGGHKDGKPA